MYRYYYDASGYADIAIGSALLMGIRLSRNFNRPFAATSVKAFWQRWHITVSHWFRDYLYAPLARRLPRRLRPYTIIFVFLIIGLWHGASWAWILFGLAHGLAYVFVERTRNWRCQLGQALGRLVGRFYAVPARATALLSSCFHVLVCFNFLMLTSVLIGVHALRDALLVYASYFDISLLNVSASALVDGTGLYRMDLCVVALSVVGLEYLEWRRVKQPTAKWLVTLPWPYRMGLAHALMFAILMFGRVETYGSTIFKAVRQKWPPTSYRVPRKSLKFPESAVAPGLTASHGKSFGTVTRSPSV